MRKKADLTPENIIPKEFVIGRNYHCSWARKRGMVWKLVSINNEKKEALIETPVTHKELTVKLSDLRNTNKHLGK